MRDKTRTPLVLVDLAFQTLLIVLGLLVIIDQDDADIVAFLALWSLVATAYLLVAMVFVAASVRRPFGAAPAVLEHSRVARVVSNTATIVSSIIGIGAAFTLLYLRNDPELGDGIVGVGVWGMLTAWTYFHWGYARIYATRYRLAADPPLQFPGTAEPRLSDFVYFSFTNATSLSTSDVVVVSTRMRWTVVWHTTLGFFFNIFIIVLAVNTIIAT